MERRPIMKDVARRAGVSRTTVSLVLSGQGGRISEETRRRVEEAASQLAYRPSLAAQQLRTRRSRMIGLIGDEIATGPFAGGLIAGAQAAARERSHALVVMNSGREGDLDADLEALEDRGVDALIFATVMTRPVHVPARVAGTDVILLNCFDGRHRFSSVLPDDRSGGAAATAMAVEHGHRRIAWLGGERGTWPARERLTGYKAVLEQNGISFDRSLVHYGNWQADSGYELASEVLRLKKPPTVLVCGNDRMALGAYEGVRDAGFRIPDDVSVIGYDNQKEIVSYTRPPLTTIRIPYFEMGAYAASAVLDGASERNATLRCDAVIRGSLGKVKPD